MSNEEIVSLKEFMLDKFLTIEKSKDIALCALEKRLDSMNEIKGAMKDQQTHFVTRTEFDAKIDSLNSKIEVLQKMMYIGLGAILAMEIVFKLIK
jgi:hypothetical protein